MIPFRTLLASSLLTPLAAADVLTVGPGQQFPGAQAAIVAAEDGDVILLRTTSTGTLVINGKGLTLLSDVGPVTVNGRLRVTNVPARSTVFLNDLVIEGDDSYGLDATNVAGRLWVQDCAITGDDGDGFDFDQSHGYEGAYVAGVADAVFVDCAIDAGDGALGDLGGQFSYVGEGGSAMFARLSTVALYGCTLRGGHGGFYLNEGSGASAGHAYFSPDATLFAAGCTLVGGDGGPGADYDQVFGGCDNGGSGGDALHLTVSASATTLDCELTGGFGGTGYPGPCYYGGFDGPNGIASFSLGTSTHTPLAGDARTLSQPTAVIEGASFTTTYGGVGGEGYGRLRARQLDNAFVPGLNGVLHTPFLGLPALHAASTLLPATGGPLLVENRTAETFDGDVTRILEQAWTRVGTELFLTNPRMRWVLDPGI